MHPEGINTVKIDKTRRQTIDLGCSDCRFGFTDRREWQAAAKEGQDEHAEDEMVLHTDYE